MPLIETRGALTSRAYGEFALQAASVAPNYIEDVFSTWLYTGNGSTQTIANGIDLSTKGGLVWVKSRSATANHILQTGTTNLLRSNLTDAQVSAGGVFINAFNTNGFGVSTGVNDSSTNYASWTFRKQAKFFDVVTYTGNGANRTIAHNLGSVPGCIIVKRTDTTGDWQVYHRSLANTEYMVLNSTAAKATGATRWNSTTPTASVFSLGTDATVNASGGTYVAYLFAHDAGGFGLSGTDNVISCGSFTTDGSGNASVTLGWEPQWVMRKTASSATNGWEIIDNMRGMFASPNNSPFLRADSSLAESSLGTRGQFPNATGFSATGSPSTTYVYIAIRRGPMKVPTSGTSVFKAEALTPSDTQLFNTGFPVDASWGKWRTSPGNSYDSVTVYDRLRGYQLVQGAGSNNKFLLTASTAAEASNTAINTLHYSSDRNNGILYGQGAQSIPNITYAFRRAPGFFDMVCYTGDGTNPRNINHNLGAVPELMIVKRRGPSTQNWLVYHSVLGAAGGLNLNLSGAVSNPAFFWSSTPTATQFSTQLIPNSTGENYVAYLFASCPGVSKVGSYTGTATTQQINCGFTGGARFVMIKRTDSTGDWYVWDTARGIVAGNDPYLLLNSIAAEVTSTDYIDTLSTGFEISSTAPAAINASGGTFIYLAIA